MSNAEMNAVDGKGAARIVSAMVIGDVEIRQVTEQDSQQLFCGVIIRLFVSYQKIKTLSTPKMN